MYDPSKIESKWQAFWLENKTFKALDDSNKPKFYALDMFPYPSGAGLHVGHPEGYTATDIISRYKRMKGFNVLHPMGWDAFGLPAENYAIKTKIHPKETTKKSINVFRGQIQSIGFSYDWDREIATSHPDYYKWTQWFFSFLYKNGLAYKKQAPVNWCEDCKTVLANEQVVNGHCERCKNEVFQKELNQWFFKITDFIEDTENNGRKTEGLISGLKKIDWPHGTLVAQENWIGKSEGAYVDFMLKKGEEAIRVFTTRPDTLFGATYMVLAPEHPMVLEIADESKKTELEAYIDKTSKKTPLERRENKEKTGVFTGAYAVNPLTGEEVPVWISDYVLMGYGTGAIMSVPGHDERDFEFAREFDLPIKFVVEHKAKEGNATALPKGFSEELAKNPDLGDKTVLCSEYGIAMNSSNQDFSIDGLKTAEAKSKVIDYLEEKGIGERSIQYKLRDWLVSRQRYWGAPIPVVYDDQDAAYVIPEDELPVCLPSDVDFNPTGESPLIHSESFHAAEDLKRIEDKLKASGQLPADRTIVRRESDTMDTFVCSSWYMFRFADPKNDSAFADPELLKKWCPIDLYVGGAEHTVLHLLYSRFFTKALHRFGYIDFDEPFTKLRHQGMILGEDNEKMSKSRGNVINPDDVIKAYGSDTLRLYEMFMGPFDAMKPWSTKSIEGCFRFAQKVWRLYEEGNLSDEAPSEGVNRLLHKTIKKVTEDIQEFRFNTAISAMMILSNEMMKEKSVSKEALEKLVLILSPFTPHLSEEIWQGLGYSDSLAYEDWPTYDEALTIDNTFELVFAVNGKKRSSAEVAKDIAEEEAIELAMQDVAIQRNIEGKTVIKKIYVKGKLVNIVVK